MKDSNCSRRLVDWAAAQDIMHQNDRKYNLPNLSKKKNTTYAKADEYPEPALTADASCSSPDWG